MSTPELIAALLRLANRVRELRDDDWVPEIEAALKRAERTIREVAVQIECR